MGVVDREGEMKTEIARLKRDIKEAYQAVGVMASDMGYFVDESPRLACIEKLLNNLQAAIRGEPRRHEDLLPFILWPA